MHSNSTLAAFALALAVTSIGACGRDTAAVAQQEPAPAQQQPRQPAPPAASRVRVSVRATGYEPATINAPANQPITIVFNRVDDGGCGGEVVFPEHDIRRTLPAGQDVEVTLTPHDAEQIHFACGMNMLHGTIVASAH